MDFKNKLARGEEKAKRVERKSKKKILHDEKGVGRRKESSLKKKISMIFILEEFQ